MENLDLDGRLVGPGESPYIIAEIGANHNGDMQLCRRLIDSAKACGADAVKFQSWTKSSLFSRAEYQRHEALEEAVERYQLSADDHHCMASYCRQQDLHFLSTCFSPPEVDLLDELDVPAFKIASMDVNHLPLLEYVGRKQKPVILSTGMASLGEIERALEVLCASGSGPVALLHCVAIYPPRPEDINLRNMATLQAAFDTPVGFSDHSIGTPIPLAAIALGASIVEKHFTLDKSLEGWDHAISADPRELKAIVHGGREVHTALGSSVRRISHAEMEKRRSFRRRLVVRRAMRQGDVIRMDDLDFKRPGTGVGPDQIAYVVGRRLVKDLEEDGEIEWADVA